MPLIIVILSIPHAKELQLGSFSKEHTPLHLIPTTFEHNSLSNNLVIKVRAHSSVLEHLLHFLLRETHMRDGLSGFVAILIVRSGNSQLWALD